MSSFLLEIIITILVAAVFAGLVFFGKAVWGKLVSWRRKSVQSDFDRELSDEEIDLIEHCIDALEEHVARYRKSSQFWFFYLGSSVIVLAPVAIYVWVMLSGDSSGLGSAFFRDYRIPEAGWFIYSDLFGVADVIALFTVIIVWGTFLTWLTSFWDWATEWSVLVNKTQNTKDVEDRLGKLIGDIVLDVRKRLIQKKSDFEPSSFLRRQYQLYLKYFLWGSYAVVVLNAAFFYLDRRAYTLVTPDSVTFVDYWSGTVHRVPVFAVEGLEFDCGESGDTTLRIMASVVISEDQRIKIMDFENPRTVKNNLPNRLSDMETLSEIFRTQGAMVILDLDKGRSTTSQQLAYCRTQLERQLDSRTAIRVVQLMRPSSEP